MSLITHIERVMPRPQLTATYILPSDNFIREELIDELTVVGLCEALVLTSRKGGVRQQFYLLP